MVRIFDYTKLENRTWDKEVLNYIGLIHEFKGRQQLYLAQKPADLDRLVDLAKIQSTEASNAIEGIFTTNQRLAQLMSEKTTPRNRNEKESNCIIGVRRRIDGGILPERSHERG